jgi:hypothetical protein
MRPARHTPLGFLLSLSSAHLPIVLDVRRWNAQVVEFSGYLETGPPVYGQSVVNVPNHINFSPLAPDIIVARHEASRGFATFNCKSVWNDTTGVSTLASGAVHAIRVKDGWLVDRRGGAKLGQ